MQERRLYPRYPWEHAVQLRGPQGESFDAMSSDISVAGIGLELSRESVLALAQGGSILSPGDHVRVLLRASDTGILRDLDLRCRVKEVRRISHERYVAGTWFEELDERTEHVLGGLVAAAQRARWG